MAGWCFIPTRRAFVVLDQARMLADRMRGHLKIAALIADLDDAGIGEIVRMVQPDFLQLHGQESVTAYR